ncbi:hypothetical protein [Streptomyces sp. NPDC018059]|uniref:hypothetical protein n=1 Tax=Streptomyces sp. NPDC018059 TaxID=3365041 RepID=UPI00378F8DF9
MAIKLDVLVGAGTTLLAVPLTWWLSTATTARANAAAERAQVRDQADALLVAVAEVKAVAITNHQTTESRRQRIATHGLAQMAFWGGVARTQGSGWRRVGGGGGELARWLAQERHEERRNLTGLPPVMTRIYATAAPLLRHPDPQVIATTSTLLDAVSELSDEARLEAALHAFGQVVQAAAATPPTPSLVRLTQRFRRPPAIGD